MLVELFGYCVANLLKFVVLFASAEMLAVTIDSRKHTLLVVAPPNIPQIPAFLARIDHSPQNPRFLPVIPLSPWWPFRYAPTAAQYVLPFCLANLELTLRGRCPTKSASSHMPSATYIRSSTDNADIRQTSTVSQIKNLMDTLVSGCTSDIADCKDLVALQEIAFGDVPSSRVEIAKAG